MISIAFLHWRFSHSQVLGPKKPLTGWAMEDLAGAYQRRAERGQVFVWKTPGERWGKPFGKGSTFIFGGEVLETNQINLFVFNIYGFDIIYLSFLFCFICVFLFSLFIIIGGEQQK
jgi:hypothetical protein